MSMKKYSDTIGNQTHDLPAFTTHIVEVLCGPISITHQKHNFSILNPYPANVGYRVSP
jgi:hypothetical protein